MDFPDEITFENAKQACRQLGLSDELINRATNVEIKPSQVIIHYEDYNEIPHKRLIEIKVKR